MTEAEAAKRVITGGFHPITRDELIFMRQSLRLSNVPYTYLALQLDYPRNLRGNFKVDVKKFILSWGIPRSSFYKAIGELDELNVLAITSVEVQLFWRDIPQNSTRTELSHIRDIGSDVRQQSQIRDSKSQIRDKKSSKTALSKSSRSLQISTDHYREEREKEENNFSEEKEHSEQEPIFTGLSNGQVPSSALNDQPVKASITQKGNTPAANDDPKNFKTYVSFESGSCNWGEYACPGFGGSDPQYFVYRRAKTVLLAQERERQKAEGKKRVKLIDEVDSYTCACIARGGARDYDEWLRDGRPLEPPLVVAAAAPAAAMQNTQVEPCVNQAKSLVLDTAPQFATPITPDQVLAKRREMLSQLFERGDLAKMRELLTTWLAAKDCAIAQLLKDQPWGLTVKAGRIVVVECSAK